MQIFLSGPPGVGKSTILQKIRSERDVAPKKGFVVHEILGEEERVGFELEFLDRENRNLLAHTQRMLSGTKMGDYSVDVKMIEEVLVPYNYAFSREENDEVFLLDEIGRMQNKSPLFLDSVDTLLNSGKSVIATIVYDDEPWARKYKEREESFYINVSRENRDDIPELVSMLMKQRSKFGQLKASTQKAVVSLFHQYLKAGKKIELKKLINHTLAYLPSQTSPGKIEKITDHSYRVQGNHGSYKVEKKDGQYSCECDFFLGKKQYQGQAGECSHIQTGKIFD